jgi:hypothetical protein
MVERLQARQRHFKEKGMTEAELPKDGRIQLEAVSMWLRSAPDPEFDALLAEARALPLQPPDIIEIMEFKALSALRAGRRADGLRLLDEALADAEKTAQVLINRLRRQRANVTALAS